MYTYIIYTNVCVYIPALYVYVTIINVFSHTALTPTIKQTSQR